MKNQEQRMGTVKTLVALLAAAGLAGAVLAGCADANSKDEAAAAAPAAPPPAAARSLEKPVAVSLEF